MATDETTHGEARLIEHLIGSVLASVVKAQGLAASQLLDMVEAIGFEGPERKTRMFDFSFMRSEVDQTQDPPRVVQRLVNASVPLLTIINLPSIAIQEAIIDMDLQLVAQETTGIEGEKEKSPLRLHVIPAKQQVVRTSGQALAIDTAGTIKMHITMRQEPAVGLEKIQSLLGSGVSEKIETLTPPPVG